MAVLVPSLRKPAIFGAIAALFCFTPAASAPVQVGIAASVTGDVRLNNATITKPRKIQRRQRLAWGDTLRTKKNSKVQILLLDRSSLTVTSNARLTINRFVYDPGQSRSLGATVTKGAFRFMSGRRTGNSRANVDSKIGTIGIRGTVLDGVVGEKAVEIAKDEPFLGPFLDDVKSDKETATLVVLRGPGAATQGGLQVGLADVTAAGVTVNLEAPAMAAYIPRPGHPPIGPFRLSQPGLQQLQYRLAPRVHNAGDGGLLGKLLPAVAAGVLAGVLLTDGDDDNPNGTTVNPNNPTAQPSPTPTPTCTPGANNYC